MIELINLIKKTKFLLKKKDLTNTKKTPMQYQTNLMLNDKIN
jgi:hypothetical protein